MSLVLSDSRSPIMEPVKKNRWLMQFNFSQTTKLIEADALEDLSFVAVSAVAPAISFAANEYARLNERFYTAGKPQWSELPMTFYDFINAEKSAAASLYKWMTAIYDPLTGAMKYKKDFYATGTLAQLDPGGSPVRIWNLYYMWPISVNFGDGLEASSEDVSLISATFRYDFALKQNESLSSTPSA